jgi:hypothetical protein
MKMHRVPRAFKQAIERDNEWFRANPAARFRCRHVEGAELPRAMRGHGIRTVVIERAGPSEFLRTFYDTQGRQVFAGFDNYYEQIGPPGPSYPIGIKHDDCGAIQEMIVNREDVALADREWFEQHPGEPEWDALPAIATKPSGLVVLDGDRHHKDQDGVAALLDLFRGHSGCPKTPVVKTPSGGIHVYFRARPDSPLSNSSQGLPKGIDVKASGGDYGGYVMASGASLADDQAYEQVQGVPDFWDAIKTNAISLVPDWLLGMLENAQIAIKLVANFNYQYGFPWRS